MIRIPPDHHEVELYVTYFLDRLSPRQEMGTAETSPSYQDIDLKKKATYFARRQLLQVKTSNALVSWAEQWIEADDWRRARDTVRAWRYKARNQLVRASLKEETKAILDARAQALNIPLWRYLQCLDLSTEKLESLEKEAGLWTVPNE